MCGSNTKLETGNQKSSKSKTEKGKVRESKIDHSENQSTDAASGKTSKLSDIEKKQLRDERKKLKKQKRKEQRKQNKLHAKAKLKEKKLPNGLHHPNNPKTSKTSKNSGVEGSPQKRKLHKGHTVQFNGRLSKRFHQVYQEEQNFIANAMKHVPKLGHNEDDLEDYLIQSDESELELKLAKLTTPTKSGKKRKHEVGGRDSKEDATVADSADGDDSELDNEAMSRQKFLESLAVLRKNKEAKVESEVNREELKARLAAKLEVIRKEKERTSTKPKKKKKKDKQSDDKKKQFISKANPNVTPNKIGKSSASVSVKDETNSISSTVSTASSNEQKTPIRKNQVVKSNGQVVYSKFDFISDDKYYNTKQYAEKKVAPKPTDLLKKVEKYEQKVSKLESVGKTSEALALTDETKWATAMKRAQGQKVRDDPTLLKKTIKKESKLKDVKRKKWTERKDHVEKQKQKVQEKRQANIQQRKDEKKKRSLKLQRKRGRIA